MTAPTKAQRLTAAQLRERGATYQEIADHCGLSSPGLAADIVEATNSGSVSPSLRYIDNAASRWVLDAACRHADPELFHPHGNDWTTGDNPERAEQAKAVCAGCPVLASCRAQALLVRDDWSIRGGLTPDERRELRRPTTPRSA